MSSQCNLFIFFLNKIKLAPYSWFLLWKKSASLLLILVWGVGPTERPNLTAEMNLWAPNGGAKIIQKLNHSRTRRHVVFLISAFLYLSNNTQKVFCIYQKGLLCLCFAALISPQFLTNFLIIHFRCFQSNFRNIRRSLVKILRLENPTDDWLSWHESNGEIRTVTFNQCSARGSFICTLLPFFFFPPLFWFMR